jgi:hypothetical protein
MVPEIDVWDGGFTIGCIRQIGSSVADVFSNAVAIS